MIEEKISYESRKEKLPKKKMAKTSKEELMYYLSPFYSEDAIKDLNEDQLDDLLDEVIDRVYKIKMKRGGIIKDPRFDYYDDGGPVKPSEYLELQLQLNQMSDEEKKNLQFMLDALLNKAKDKK